MEQVALHVPVERVNHSLCERIEAVVTLRQLTTKWPILVASCNSSTIAMVPNC